MRQPCFIFMPDLRGWIALGEFSAISEILEKILKINCEYTVNMIKYAQNIFKIRIFYGGRRKR